MKLMIGMGASPQKRIFTSYWYEASEKTVQGNGEWEFSGREYALAAAGLLHNGTSYLAPSQPMTLTENVRSTVGQEWCLENTFQCPKSTNWETFTGQECSIYVHNFPGLFRPDIKMLILKDI